MTKGKVIQIGLIIALVGFISFKVLPVIGYTDLTTNSISNVILISIVFLWVLSYVIRVLNGKMTFMEQRKRYRAKYEKVIDEKLKSKFDSLSSEEKEKLLKEIEEK